MAEPNELISQAKMIASFFRTDQRIDAVCLVGSHARGDATHASDLDLLVLTTEAFRPGHLRDRLAAARLSFRELSLLPQTSSRFQAAAADGSLFVLHASREGDVLFDRGGTLRRAFRTVNEASLDIDGEIQRRIHRLRYYDEVGRFNGNLLFPLASVYGSGKGVAIALTARYGCLTFVKDEAFRRVVDCRPHLKPHVDVISQLQPFYDLTRNKISPHALPFDYHKAESQLRRAVTAVRSLAEVVVDAS